MAPQFSVTLSALQDKQRGKGRFFFFFLRKLFCACSWLVKEGHFWMTVLWDEQWPCTVWLDHIHVSALGFTNFPLLFPSSCLVWDTQGITHPFTIAGTTQWQALGMLKKEQISVGTDWQMEPLTATQKVPENPDFGCSLFPHAVMPFWRENEYHSY